MIRPTTNAINSIVRKWIFLSIGVALACVSINRIQAAIGDKDPRVLPPQSNFRGLNYGEWEAEWWKSLFEVPVVDDHHPYFTGEPFSGPKGMLFLCPILGPVNIEVTIPTGTPIFCPVVYIECSTIEPPPFSGDTELELRTCATGLIDESSGLFAEIDGKAVHNLAAYRAQSPPFEFGPLPSANLFDYVYGNAPTGTTGFSVASGVNVLLPDLCVGKHSVHVGATFGPSLDGMVIETTFSITVLPKKKWSDEKPFYCEGTSRSHHQKTGPPTLRLNHR